MTNNVTFVTAYLKVYDVDYHESRTFEKRLEFFMKIAELNINICLFVSPEYKDTFDLITTKYKNINIIEVLSIEDLEFTKLGNKNADLLNLPDIRSYEKDTSNYIFLMHSKIEFIKKTIDINPFNNDHFCWFDFSLPYTFKDPEKSIFNLKVYSECSFIHEPFIIMPGCWSSKYGNIKFLKDYVCWRFCGSFLMGDKNSLLSFYDVSKSHFEDFLTLTGKLVWEVNYWAWLEAEGYISPIWYLSGHDDTQLIIQTQVVKTSDYI